MKKNYPCGFLYDVKSSILSWKDPAGALERKIKVGHREAEGWCWENLILNFGDRSSIFILLDVKKRMRVKGKALFRATGWSEFGDEEELEVRENNK